MRKRLEKVTKACKCGKVHDSVPNPLGITEFGLWFNCECGSTLLVEMKWEDLDWRPDEFDERIYERIKRAA